MRWARQKVEDVFLQTTQFWVLNFMCSLSNLWHVFHVAMSYCHIFYLWGGLFLQRRGSVVQPGCIHQGTGADGSQRRGLQSQLRTLSTTTCPVWELQVFLWWGESVKWMQKAFVKWWAKWIEFLSEVVLSPWSGERLLTAAGGLFAHSIRVQRHPWDWQLLLNEILSPSVFQIFLLEVTPEVLPSGLTLPRKAPLKGTAMYLPLRRAFPSDLLGELHPSTLLFLRQLVVCTWWRWLRCLSHLRYCFHRLPSLLCRAGSRRLTSITVENERETPCHCYTYVLSKSSQDHRIDVVTCKKIKSDGEDLPVKEEEKGWRMLMGYWQGRIWIPQKVDKWSYNNQHSTWYLLRSSYGKVLSYQSLFDHHNS